MLSKLLHANVMHQRLRPRRHRFVHPVFMVCLDLAELSVPSSPLQSWIFGVNCWRPVSLWLKDYGPRDGTDLLVWIKDLLAQRQIQDIARVELLTFPRVLNYAFNPISLWYCYDQHDQLRTVLAEVNNTFGEHHFYLLRAPAETRIDAKTILQSQKMMHVSPFCEVRGHYEFQFLDTNKRRKVNINYFDDEGLLLQTAIVGKHISWSVKNVLRTLVRQPFMSLGVIIKIHWHAALLWLKRVPFYRQSNFTNRQVSLGEIVQQEQIK